MEGRREEVDDETVVAVRCDGTFDMEVKGESHHQDAIAGCVAGAELDVTSDDACSCEFSVRLVREPDNAYDANAIAVRSPAGETLGYLSREDAREYAPVLDRIADRATVECAGRAYGRREGSRSPWNFGIWLDLPDASRLEDALGELVRGGGVLSGDRAKHGRSGENRESLIAESCPACGATTSTAATFSPSFKNTPASTRRLSLPRIGSTPSPAHDVALRAATRRRILPVTGSSLGAATQGRCCQSPAHVTIRT